MSDIFVVKNVSDETKEWEGQYGTMKTYFIDLEQDGHLHTGIEMNRKPESRPPEEGDRMAGSLEETKYGTKFKLDFEATKELKGGPKLASAPTQHNNNIEASIYRQVALKVLSPAICESGWNAGMEKEVEAIEKFIAEAGSSAGEVKDLSPPVAPPQQKAPTDDKHQYLSNLLESAFVNPNGAAHLANYMLDRFDTKKLAKAEHGLLDMETQPNTVKQLTAAYERDMKSSLPDEADDGHIPFHHPEYEEVFSERERRRHR